MQPLLSVFGAGPWEMVIVALVILILFGNRLPKVMRSMGQGVTEFKKGLGESTEDPPPTKQVDHE